MALPPTNIAHSGITYLTSTRVTAADVTAKTLTTASGDTITYEKLVIATGARVSTMDAERINEQSTATSPCTLPRHHIPLACPHRPHTYVVEYN